MKKSIILAGMACLAALPTHAQDWDGAYAGLLAGGSTGGWRDQYYDWTFPYSGLTGGAFVGYRFEAGSLVTGVEASAMLSAMERIDAGVYNGTVMGMGAMANARALAGYKVGNALPYIAAGVVAGSQRFISGTPGFGRDEELHFGTHLAAGIDVAATDTVFVRAEVNYASFGHNTYDLGKGGFTGWPAEQLGGLLGVGFKF